MAYVGILRLGAVVVPANTAYTLPELNHIVSDVQPALAVVDEPARLGGLTTRTTQANLSALPEVSGPIALDRAASTDAAMIAYTSGTTGLPKGAVLTHGNLIAGADSSCRPGSGQLPTVWS